MDAQWHLAKRIFQKAIELPQSEQEKFVQSQCDDADVAGQVMEMLKSHGDESEFLSSPFSGSDGDGFSRDPLIGHTFGKFQILRRIGKGGMGAVYAANQSEPRREVAIKVLRHDSVASKKMLQRFQNESAILAKLQHPNIAYVFASGTFQDEDGLQPWFAMELIEGLTLSQHLRQHRYTEQEKLELFLRICEGVSHAHRRDVIHRDLKPANILIVETESNTQPKIVDFGIARFNVCDRTNLTMTKTQAVLGSIDYLSPEQVNLEHGKLDHRCDIYSLGVIVFEMLTGRLPHDRRSGSLTSVVNQIQMEPGAQLKQLDGRFSKDLNVIVSKSMAIDPQQRYQDVESLAEDIRRYLNGQPILARPLSLSYRLTRYVSRNKVLIAGASTTILALLIGLIGYAISADRANRAAENERYESRKSKVVSDFLTNDFFRLMLTKSQTGDVKNPMDLKMIVDDSSDLIDSMFHDEPLHEAAVRNQVGTIYYGVRMFAEAADEYSQSLELWESGLGPDHPDTLKAVSNLAQAYMGGARSRDPETLALAKRAYEGRKRVLGLSDEATVRSLNNLAHLYSSKELFEEAENLFLEGLDSIRGSTAETTLTVSALSGNLGSLYARQKRMSEALHWHERSYESAVAVLGDEHPQSLISKVKYVRTLDKAERYQDALAAIKPVLAVYQGNSDSDPAAMIYPLRLQAKIFRHLERLDDAELTLQTALKITERYPKSNRGDIKSIQNDLRYLAEKIAEAAAVK